MKKIDIKIETLGGLDPNKNKNSKGQGFLAELYLSENKLNLPTLYIEFSKKYGSHQFRNDVVFESISKIPTSYEDGTCPISVIYGWDEDLESLQETREALIDQIPEKYFVFAEANPGDQLLINTQDHKIYYWAHEEPTNKCIFLVANNFEEFIDSLRINENKTGDDDLEEEWFSDDF